MFGMGFGELLVVLVIAVIFLGPDKIPETARTLGKWFHEIKSSLDEVKTSLEADIRPSPKQDDPFPSDQPAKEPKEPKEPKES